VSNFNLQQLNELQDWAKIPPMVVQRHADLFTQDIAVQRFCQSQMIQNVAFSSLGTQYLGQGFRQSPVLHNAAVQAIAAKHNVTAAQVLCCAEQSLPSCHALCALLSLSAS
jgi:diketogulonate reductase-like aldo/keto reductase